MQRFDYFKITAQRTKEGFILDKPIVARSGLLKYINADGSERIEYRPPDEAFDAESLESILGKPVTLGHPGMVNADNAAQMPIVGAAISKGYRDGNAIRADISLFQLPTEARELSCGYTLDLDETPGITPDGQHYDAIQRNVRINHIAIVPKGRAGIARLNMDGEQEIDVSNEDKKEGVNADMAEKDMTKIRLDGGLEYDAAPEVGVYVEKLRTEIEQMRKDSEDAKAEAQKVVDTMQAKLDAAVAEKDAAVKAHEDAEKAAKENFDAAVANRVKMLAVAQENKIENADSMTDEEIKVAVIKAVRGDAIDLDGKSADYIEAAFDMAIIDAKKRADSMAEQRKNVDTHNDQQDEKNDADDVEAALEKLKAAEAEMYLKGRE